MFIIKCWENTNKKKKQKDAITYHSDKLQLANEETLMAIKSALPGFPWVPEIQSNNKKTEEEQSPSVEGLLILVLYNHSPFHPIDTSLHIYTGRPQLSENNQAGKKRGSAVCLNIF